MKDRLPAGVPEPALNRGAQLARERGLRFEVTKKAGRGRRWETVAGGVEDLVEAMSLAGRIRDTYESGVFVSQEGAGGFVYWTSLYPGLLNSSVLTLKFDHTE